ncbi:hypothetical protein SAMN05443549_1157 [Flavobacterium fluvii]|uniref:Uncharacterized protein n=1 Tax=Flavobacterium fluvii TaxID=468056 RepID=A0A1M5PYB1_9FLAO|nr:hypothetical protein [Flavobacterium fluvii]SHH06987.1 hypothetical protein SAMN05443549_1157 [Flavobacterium fluvii]
MIFNNDPRIRAFLFGIVLLILGLSYLTKILSDNFLYKYLDYFKSKFAINVLVGLHWTIPVVLACILPNYLTKYNFFKHVFEDSEIWMYLTTLCIYFISLIVVGSIFNLGFCHKVIKGNIDKNESR